MSTHPSSFVELLADYIVASADEANNEDNDAAPPSNQIELDDVNKLEPGESIDGYNSSDESGGVFMEEEAGPNPISDLDEEEIDDDSTDAAFLAALSGSFQLAAGRAGTSAGVGSSDGELQR